MDMNNKTLAVFLVIAISISLFGTIISLNKLNKLGGTTGFATSNTNGLTTLTINSTASLVFTVATVNWTEGYVNSTGDNYCNLTTGIAPVASQCTGFSTAYALQLRNDGNVNLSSVSLWFQKNATNFIGPTSGAVPINPLFQYNVTQNEANTCALGNTVSVNWTNVNDTDPGSVICNDMQYANSNDELNISIRVTIPANAPTGSKSSIVYAVGTYS